MTLSLYHHTSSTPDYSGIGQVAGNLTKLLAANFPIPKGFIISGETCKAFFNHARLQDKILQLIERCDFNNPQDIASVSKNIRKLIMAAPIPTEISEPLLQAAMKLNKDKVMLVPSPIIPAQNNELKRVYGLSGEATILQEVRELWAAQFEPSELSIVSDTREFPSMAICVQIEPKGVVSGILSTSTSDKTACQILAVWGEGGYTNKLQGADKYIIDRISGQEKNKERSIQTKEFIFTHGKAETAAVPISRQKKQKLDEKTLLTLSRLAVQIQKHAYFPQDATFVFDGDKIYLINLRQSSNEPESQVTENIVPTRQVLLKGSGLSPGIITGIVRIINGNRDVNIEPGSILVASRFSDISNEMLKSAKGLIVEEDTPKSVALNVVNKGIAMLASAAGAVDLLTPGSFVTLHSSRGEVLAGGYRSYTDETNIQTVYHSAMHVGTTISLGTPTKVSDNLINGHLILSAKKIITTLGVHPLKLIKDKKNKLLTQSITKSLSDISSHHPNVPLIYEFSALKSDEYRNLIGGKQYEPIPELNPALGYYGSARLLQIPSLVLPEIEALETIRRNSYGQRISLLLPYVRTAFEAQSWSRLLSNRLPRSASLRYYLDLSIPSMCWQISEAASFIDGVILNLDQIAESLFSADLKTGNFHYQAVDLEPTILGILETVTNTTQKEGLHLIIKGSLLEHDPYLSFVVARGIHEINVPKSLLPIIRERLTVLEQEHINHV